MGRADAERKQKATKRPQPKQQKVRAGGKQGSAKRVVDVAIRKIGAKLSSEDVKATVGDFIRLLQLQKELDEEAAKEIKITWVEPAEMASVTDE